MNEVPSGGHSSCEIFVHNESKFNNESPSSRKQNIASGNSFVATTLIKYYVLRRVKIWSYLYSMEYVYMKSLFLMSPCFPYHFIFRRTLHVCKFTAHLKLDGDRTNFSSVARQ